MQANICMSEKLCNQDRHRWLQHIDAYACMLIAFTICSGDTINTRCIAMQLHCTHALMQPIGQVHPGFFFESLSDQT